MPEQQERYFLKKTDRLKSRKAIELLFAKGKTFSEFPLKVFWIYTEETQNSLQAGFAVSSRNFKKASDRNRIKRLMREAYRLQKNDLAHAVSSEEKNMAMFFLYTGKELPAYPSIAEKIKLILNRLIKLNHGNT